MMKCTFTCSLKKTVWYWRLWLMACRFRQPDRSTSASITATSTDHPAGQAETRRVNLIISSFPSPLSQLDINCVTSRLLPPRDGKRWYISSDSNFSQRSLWWMSPPPSFSAALHRLRVDGFDLSSPESDRSRFCWFHCSFSLILGCCISLASHKTNRSLKVNLFGLRQNVPRCHWWRRWWARISSG